MTKVIDMTARLDRRRQIAAAQPKRRRRSRRPSDLVEKRARVERDVVAAEDEPRVDPTDPPMNPEDLAAPLSDDSGVDDFQDWD